MCPIRDCQHLGKYNSSSSSRPRPILFTPNSTAQVSHVLVHRNSLPSHVSVKPDCSFSERKSERILSEWWKLNQAGSDHHSIKLKNSALYLNGRLHGKVVNGTYSLASLLNDLAPELSNHCSDSQSSASSTNAPSN